MEAQLGDVDANLEMCERLAGEAGAAGAEWIVLPEFFTTGVAFRPELAERALPVDGPAAGLLAALASRHGAHVSGSFLALDADGHVRNAFLLYGPDGERLGRHDKDLPTMWENCFYVGGGDPGRIEADGLTVGVALCWELLRTQTVERLRGRVDLVVGGSAWWSIPELPPRALMRRTESRNARRAIEAAQRFAPYIGAPIVHAAHSGVLNGTWPGFPMVYHGHFEGGALVADHRGGLIAYRGREDGPGIAIGEVTTRREPSLEPPSSFWLQRRGAIAALAWAYQNAHGRRWYRRHHDPATAREPVGLA